MVDMDLHLSAFTDSKFYAGPYRASALSNFNSLVAASWVYLYPVFLIWYFKISERAIRKSEDSETADEKYKFIVEEKRLDSFWQKYIDIVRMTRNYVISAVVVGMWTRPKL